MTKLLALQHIACEPPAAYEDELRARGIGLERVELDEGHPPRLARLRRTGGDGWADGRLRPAGAPLARRREAADRGRLPPGTTLLASSPAYRSQAFVCGRAYGLQFHLEVTPELAADWGEMPAYRESLTAVRGEARSTR